MLLPMLAKATKTTSLKSFIEDPAWVMEQKLDGHRLLLCSPGGDFPPTALTRAGTPYTRKLPKEIRDFRFPGDKAHEWVLDGELVDGMYYVFDLPGEPYSNWQGALDLSQRRKMLETFLAAVEHPFKLVPQARTADEKIALAEKAISQGFEGLMLKRMDSRYLPGGRTENWLKLKFVQTADCIVLDVRDDGKDSVRLGMCADGDLRSVCDVGRASLIGKEKDGAINVGDVLEVRYLYTGAGGRLYQPTIMRKRDDKRPEECKTSQLRFVNKKVLEAL